MDERIILMCWMTLYVVSREGYVIFLVGGDVGRGLVESKEGLRTSAPDRRCIGARAVVFHLLCVKGQWTMRVFTEECRQAQA